MRLSDSPKRLAVLVALLLLLLVVSLWQLRPALVQGVLGREERPVVGRYQVPELPAAAETRSEEGRGVRRNLFTFGASPTPTPDPRPTPTPVPIPTPRPRPTPEGVALPDGQRLPPPPPFPLPYLGWLGPKVKPVAVFRDGSEVLVAPVGSVVKEKFVVREVGPTTVTIGFLGYPEEVTTQVPLAR